MPNADSKSRFTALAEFIAEQEGRLPQFSDLQKRIGYVVFAAALAVGSLFYAMAQGTVGSAASPKPSISGLSFIGPTAIATPTPSDLVVDVAGKVLHPGVYHLPAGSRIIDAISRAGGAIKGTNLADLNQAQLISDGQQVLVDGLAASTPVAAIKSSTSSRSRSSKGKSSTVIIAINSATTANFEELAGIGPVLAGRIIAYRSAHGHFATIDDLRKVQGMSLKKFNAIKKQLQL